MVKLTRINKNNINEGEQQLDLFSWTPKKVNTYDGKEDTDRSKWFNVSFLTNKYKEMNKRFFNSELPDYMPIGIKSIGRDTCGITHTVYNITRNTAEVIGIDINKNIKLTNRWVLEGILLHEMCHAYTTLILCHGKCDEDKKDANSSKGTRGHGPKFMAIASKVNDISKGIEDYKVKQYGDSEDAEFSYMVKDEKGYLGIAYDLDTIYIKVFPQSYTLDKAKKELVPRQGNIGIPYNIYTYANADVKSKVFTNMFSRGEKSFYLGSRKTLFLNRLITNGDLVPVHTYDGKGNNANIAMFLCIRDHKVVVYYFKVEGPIDSFIASLEDEGFPAREGYTLEFTSDCARVNTQILTKTLYADYKSYVTMKSLKDNGVCKLTPIEI